MEISKRRDLVLFLKEFCTFSQTLQPQSRETFFKTLASLGILPALEITLSVNDPATKSASIDILSYIVEFSPSMVRDYMLQQANSTEDEHLLLNIIIEQMMCDSDPELGGAVQLSGILRLLIDPESMMTSINKSEKTDFLNFFYKHSMHVLVNPLLSNTTGDRPTKEDYPTVQLLGLILELLSFCVEHHTYHIKNYILNRDLLRRILVLMRSRHTFLVLSALRFLRKIISLKGDYSFICPFETQSHVSLTNRRILQPIHREEQPPAAGGRRVPAQQRPLQPARLGHSRAVRVHQDRGHQVALCLRRGHVRQRPRQNRLRPNF